MESENARVGSVRRIPWGVFSKKHKEYIKRACVCTINIAEGSVRAGKTIDNCVVARDFIDFSKDKIHLASGSTIANAKLNIGDCNGFGLEHQFAGRCHWGKYKGNEALFINAKVGERILIFAGGAKADSFKKIRGNSYGLWIATEINLHHREFINEAQSRQLMASVIKILWDFNPDAPNAEIYKDHVDVYADKVKRGDMVTTYNYQHFTIFDNENMSEQRKAEVMNRWDPNSVYYKRYILGQRVQAEGLIFGHFANNKADYISDIKPTEDTIAFISIGVDFGGNKSKSGFVASAILTGWAGVVVVDDYKVSGEKGEIDGNVINREFIQFVRTVQEHYPHTEVKYGFGDSAEQYLIAGIQKACKVAGLRIAFTDCLKAHINDRIKCKSTLIYTKRWRVLEHCKHVIKSTEEQVWDSKKDTDVRLDDFTSDVDVADAEEYSWERWIKHFELKRGI